MSHRMAGALPANLMGRRAQQWAGLGFIILGMLLIAVLAAPHVSPPRAPFLYAKVEGTQMDDLAFPKGAEGISVTRYEVRRDGVEKPLARFAIAAGAGGKALISWKNELNEPVVRPDIETKAEADLAAKMEKYLPADATIMAWPDVAARLALRTGRKALFLGPTSADIAVPEPWQDARAAAIAYDAAFFTGEGISPVSDAVFADFLNALLLEPTAGVASLSALAGGKEVYLVLHVRDLLRAAAAEPRRLVLTYKHFAGTGNAHGTILAVKDFLKGHANKPYLVDQLDVNRTWVYFLENPADAERLIVKLLPFNASNPFAVAGLSVVYQQSGYWVFRIRAAGASGAS